MACEGEGVGNLSYNLIRPIATRFGFCCVYALIRALRGRSHDQLAASLNLHRNTIRVWRKRVKLKECECSRYETCAKRKWFGEVPRVELENLHPGTDPFES